MAQPAGRPARRLGRLIGLGLGAVVLVVALALVASFVVPHVSAATDFNRAVSDFGQAKDNLMRQIDDVAAVGSAYPADQLADASALDRFQAALATARALVQADPPTMAAATPDIRHQADALRDDIAAMETSQAALQVAAGAIQQTHLAWAKTTLTDAIAQAQQAQAAAAGQADPAAQAALEQLIGQAQQALAAVNQANLATLGDLVSQLVGGLGQAALAVQAPPPAPVCGPNLPAGVDPMVCAGLPAGAVSVTVGANPALAVFSMPSLNIGCAVAGTLGAADAPVVCEIVRYSWSLPAELVQPCGGGCTPLISLVGGQVAVVNLPSGPAPWSQARSAGLAVPVLRYGQVADFSPVACLSATDGVTCWDTTTHHGFKMSSDHLVYW